MLTRAKERISTNIRLNPPASTRNVFNSYFSNIKTHDSDPK